MSNKLSHIYNIAGNLQRDIKIFYDSPDFCIEEEACLSDEYSEFNHVLASMKDGCNLINSKIEGEISDVKERLSQSRT